MCSILLIEDDAGVRRSLRDILEGAGHHVIDASDGFEGLRRYRVYPADVIIADTHPAEPGLETIVGIRREFPDVKIIALSSGDPVSPGARDHGVARAMGAQVALDKPVTGEELLEAVRRLAGKS